MQDALAIGLALICVGAGTATLYFAVRPRTQASLAQPDDSPASNTGLPRRAASQLPLLTGSELLERTGAQGLLERIRSQMGLTPDNFERDVLTLVHRFAEFVQLLPASESHHHAQPGGLLVHSMECAAQALQLRQGYKLPVDATPEDQIRLSAVWSYGVLVAALLHDIGKPIADVVVDLYGTDATAPLGRWSALAGSMRSSELASHYTVAFPQTRDYAAHSRLPVTLLHAMVPASALQWLATDPKLLQELLTYLTGESSTGVLHEIVTQADQQSVADNLKSGPRTRFASARSVPLIERLMLGLRALFAESHLAINRPGAAAFVDPDNQHVWIVAGAAAEQTRKLLEQREEKQTGAAHLPSDNTRFFDTWAEYDVLIPPPKEFGKGSVWWVRIELEDWSQVLTVLKFPLNKIYPPQTPWPAPLKGSIIPVAPTSKTERTALTEDAVPQEPVAQDAPSVAEESPATDDWRSLIKSPSPALAQQAVAVDTTPTAPADEFLDEAETAPAIKATTAPLCAIPGKTVQALNKAPKALFKAPNAKPKENAERFMAWVQQSLGTGELNYNESDAVVHFVDQGMALVSPKIFRLYLETHEFTGSVGNSKDALRALQQEVQKGGYIARNPDDKSSFHYFQVQREGEEGGAVINCYLIPNPQAYIRPVPSPNPLLKRCAKPAKGQSSSA